MPKRVQTRKAKARLHVFSVRDMLFPLTSASSCSPSADTTRRSGGKSPRTLSSARRRQTVRSFRRSAHTLERTRRKLVDASPTRAA